MTVSVVPLKRWHIAWLAEGGVAPAYSEEMLDCMERYVSFTSVCDGKPTACGGVIEQWPGRSVGWAYLNEKSAGHMVHITKAARGCLARVKGRIELTVRCEFEAGHRWAKLLGFEVETPIMKAYGPEGESHTGYVRYN